MADGPAPAGAGGAADGSRVLSKIAEPGATAGFPMIGKDLVPLAVPDPSGSREGAAAAVPLPADVRDQVEQVASIASRRAGLA
jgi:hypothetical protein